MLLLFLQRGPITPCFEELSPPKNESNRKAALALLCFSLLVLVPFPIEVAYAILQVPSRRREGGGRLRVPPRRRPRVGAVRCRNMRCVAKGHRALVRHTAGATSDCWASIAHARDHTIKIAIR